MNLRKKAALCAAIATLACNALAAPLSTDDAFTGAAIGTVVNVGVIGATHAFDGMNGDNVPANTLFTSGRVGQVGSVAFSTANAVSLDGIRLFAGSDGEAFDYRRAMSAFRFYADTDNNGSYEQLVSQALNPLYAQEGLNVADQGAFPNRLEITFMFDSPVVASLWKYEVVQAFNHGSGFDGVRVLEVDAISTAANSVPEPGTLALLGLALVGLTPMRKRRES